ncbi:MAG: DUF3987 domain-containing protein [Clostridium sp.]|nr:DUF3987 domain-containing protein [Clostridium sp.]
MKQQNNVMPSLLNGFDTTQSRPATWDEALQLMRSGALDELTLRYRRTGHRQWKSRLPCLTPAVRLDGTGKREENITALTGVTMVDLDRLPPERVEEVRRLVNADPHTMMSHVTVSGRGVRVMCRYEPVPGTADRDAYRRAFLIANCHYADLTGVPFDASCANPGRLSALCHDPLALLRPEAEPFCTDELTPHIVWDDSTGAETSAADSDACAEAPADPATPAAGDYPTPVANPSDAPAEAAPMSDAVPGGAPAEGAFAPAALTPRGVSRRFVFHTRSETPVEFVERVVRSHGYSYAPGGRNDYLMRCLMMLNRLGMSRSEADSWARGRGSDLGSGEVDAIVRSCYSHTADFGTWTMPAPRRGGGGAGGAARGTRGTQGTAPLHSTRAGTLLYGEAGTEDDDLGPDEVADEVFDGTDPHLPLPVFDRPAGVWPPLLARVVEAGRTPAQRDILLLGALCVFGATVAPRVRTLYDGRWLAPSLMFFAVAPPASGKGALSWLRHIVQPYHDELRGRYEAEMCVYKQQKQLYDSRGSRRSEVAPQDVPVPPVRRMFIIPGNNSGTGIQANLIDSGGHGIIFQTEADTLSAALNADYGHFDDALRNAFDHEGIAFYRRTDDECKAVAATYLSILLSGTPGQVRALIKTYANGLASRFAFYYMPPVRRWQSQFDRPDDMDALFRTLAAEWKQRVDALRSVSHLTFRLTPAQQQRLDACMAALFRRGQNAVGVEAVSTVVRIAPQLLRMMSVVALMRCLHTGQGLEPDADLPADNVDDGIVPRYTYGIGEADFGHVMELGGVMFSHAMHVLSLMPEVELTHRGSADREALFSRMGDTFTRRDYLAQAGELGIKIPTAVQWLKRARRQGRLWKSEDGVYSFPPSDLA